MLILTKNDMQKIFSMKMAIEASKEALALYSNGKSVVPLRVILDIPKNHGQSLFMPAYIDSLNVTGIKIVSVYPKNIAENKPSITGKMMLLNACTGEVCAMMDGAYLTQLRTGALQGAATDILARTDAKIAVLFGTGAQAATQLEAMLNVRNLKEVRVFDINFERAQLFATTMQKEFSEFNTNIIAVENGNETIIDADIITTVTTSKKPVFDAAFVKMGAHINGIGSYTPEMQELPELLLKKADKIIFDTNEGVLSEAGDILIPFQLGTLKQSEFNGELGEVILGHKKGRETPHEITLFKAVGSAIFDLVTAHYIYVKALEQKIGHFINI